MSNANAVERPALYEGFHGHVVRTSRLIRTLGRTMLLTSGEDKCMRFSEGKSYSRRASLMLDK